MPMYIQKLQVGCDLHWVNHGNDAASNFNPIPSKSSVTIS